jgi:hypothetical protein
MGLSVSIPYNRIKDHKNKKIIIKSLQEAYTGEGDNREGNEKWVG